MYKQNLDMLIFLKEEWVVEIDSQISKHMHCRVYTLELAIHNGLKRKYLSIAFARILFSF